MLFNKILFSLLIFSTGFAVANNDLRPDLESGFRAVAVPVVTEPATTYEVLSAHHDEICRLNQRIGVLGQINEKLARNQRDLYCATAVAVVFTGVCLASNWITTGCPGLF